MPRSAVNAPIQFQQFDQDEEIQPLAFDQMGQMPQMPQMPQMHQMHQMQQQQQQQPQFFNSNNPNSFGVITVPDGSFPSNIVQTVPFQFTQGVPEFAFANIPTNVAFNFGDNFAMQNQFGPPSIPMNPPPTDHFVGFNEQFPNSSEINNDMVNHSMANQPDIPSDHNIINQNGEDIEKCARINTNNMGNVNNMENNNSNEEEEVNMVDSNFMIQNGSNDDYNSNHNNHYEPIQQDQDLLPPAIHEQPMRQQYSRCSEASNTTNTTHLSHESHAAINVHNNNYNQV